MIRIPEETKRWLLGCSVPAARYGAQKLFHPGSEDVGLLLLDPLIVESREALKTWDREILKQHNKPDLLMHRLSFLADSGVTRETPGIGEIGETILGTFDSDGVPRIRTLIPKAFRGSGEVESAWMICDYPLILASLLRMGFRNDLTRKSAHFLSRLSRENGMPCLSSLPGFRGPGPKKDFCPIASLFSLKALNQLEETRTGEAAHRSSASLLGHWELRKEKKFYLFGIGTDFQKLKYPLVWYNLLHVLDALSESDLPEGHPALGEMADLLASKADGELRFTPESMYLFYKGRDFSNKREPSPSLTLRALQILTRLGRVSRGG